MKDWFLGRAKAFIGFMIPGITTALIEAGEKSFGFELGMETKTTIVMTVTGLFVYQVPNKAAS